MKRYIKFCLFLLSFILFFVLTPPKSFAQSCDTIGSQGTCPTNFTCVKVDPNCTSNSPLIKKCAGECKPKATPTPSKCEQAGSKCCPGAHNQPNYCDGGLTCDLGKSDTCFKLVPQPDGQGCNSRLGGKDCQSGYCDNNTCKPKPLPTASKCDALGEACCFVAHNLPKTCDGGLTCINDKCSADCGAKDQQCCRTRGETKGSCDKEPNLECSNNKCQIIGEAKDPPDPPEPPCAKKNAAGECEQFSTALGSFATDPGKFVASVFAILLAASGAIALLLIIRAGYKIMTSQGKPDTIQEGREQLIAAVVGLLFLIFSLVFLEVIGVDILQIPGSEGKKGFDVPKGAPKGAMCSSGYQDPSIIVQGSCEKGLLCGDIDPSQCRDDGCLGTCK